MRAIVTVIGVDKVGIIAAITTALAERQANVLDIRQTTLQEYFTMIMLVDLAEMSVSFSEMEKALDQTGTSIGVSIRIQREDIFKSMHRV
jgi:ACT domain-containing protein